MHLESREDSSKTPHVAIELVTKVSPMARIRYSFGCRSCPRSRWTRGEPGGERVLLRSGSCSTVASKRALVRSERTVYE